jgi:DNA-binding response OmpR family regulator
MTVSVVSDGETAMSFLRREGDFAAAPRPDLILLDLNLPRKCRSTSSSSRWSSFPAADGGGRCG